MKKAYSILFLFFNIAIFGQAWEWAKDGKGINDIRTELDDSGFVYTCGVYHGNCSINDLSFTSADSCGAFIMKMNSSGNVIWSKNFSASYLDIVEIKIVNNEIYLGGTFRGSLSFNNKLYNSAGKNDLYFLKLDILGNRIRLITDGGPENESLYCMDVSVTGIIASGDFSPGGKLSGIDLISQTATNIFLASYTSAGQNNWVKQIIGAFAQFVKSDPKGGFYLIGHFVGKFVLNGIDTTYFDDEERFQPLLKYNSDGSFNSVFMDLSGYLVSATAFEIDRNGVLYITKAESGNHSPPTMSLNKIGADGTIIWKKYAGGGVFSSGGSCVARKIKIKENKILVAGTYSGEMYLPPGSPHLSGSGFFIFDYDTSGTLHNVRNSIGVGSSKIGGLGLDAGGNIYISAFTKDKNLFGDLTVADSSGFIVKLNAGLQESPPQITVDPYNECAGKWFAFTSEIKNVSYIKWSIGGQKDPYDLPFFFQSNFGLWYDTAGVFSAYVIIENSVKRDSIFFKDLFHIYYQASPIIEQQGNYLVCIPPLDSFRSYSWYFNNNALYQYGSFEIPLTDTGIYYLKAQYKNWCYGKSEIFHYKGSPLSSSAQSYLEMIKLFPIPTSGQITIQFNDPVSKIRISVYNLLGNCVLTQSPGYTTTHIVDLAGKPKGIYFVDVMADGKRTVKKIILE